MEVFDVTNNVYFRDKQNGILIEVGAYDGLIESCGYKFENHLNWKSINIEADKSLFQALINNRPKSVNLNYALCDKDDCELTFYITSQAGNSSFEHSQRHLEELNSHKSTITEQKVQTISWKNLIKKYNIEYLDFLCLDIEGTEKYALRDMIDSDVLPEVICIEVGYEWKEKKELLKTLGYRFDFFHYNNAYCSKHKMSINEIKINDYFQNEWYVDDKLIYQYEKDKF